MMNGFVKRPDLPVLYDPFRDIRAGPLGPVRDAAEIMQICRELRDRLICW